jgi:hypothetical protein
MTKEMTTKQKLQDVLKYLPGDLGDIAMMFPCHVQTLYNINAEKGTPRAIIVDKLNALHGKAMEIKAISES